MVQRSPCYQRLVASLDTVIIRSRNSGTMPNTFIYFLCRTEMFTDHTYAHVTGTTVLHLAKQAIPSFRFALPPLKLRQVFDQFASPIATKIEQIEVEREVLAGLRDALLPKLISGELRVKDAESFLRDRGT